MTRRTILIVCLLLSTVSTAHAARLRFANILSPEEAQTCGGDFQRARLSGWIWQERGHTILYVVCKRCAPNTLFTLWQRFASGEHPTTGLGVAALLPADIEAELIDNDPAPPNGFWTNGRGTGKKLVKLPFPVIKGAFRFTSGEILPLHQAPEGSIRVASHCVDGVGHGRVPGEPHEVWFDLQGNPFQNKRGSE